MLIHLRERKISFDGATLKTRSKELVRFVGYLAWRFRERGGPEWVGIEEMRGVVGSAEPKQYSRYLDKLEKAGLAVVEYRHKTKGPWRLFENIRNISFDLDENELARCFPAAPEKLRQSAEHSGIGGELYNFVKLCAEADACFHDGDLMDDNKQSALVLLAGNRFFSPAPELEILLHLKIARASMRASHYDEAATALKHAEEVAARNPMPHGELDYRIRLVKAKLLFDQGKTSQSAALLDSIPIRECRDTHTLAQYHNMMGLIINRQLRMDINAGKKPPEALAREAFERCSEHLQRAIVMHLFINDYHGVQAACFNLGNLFSYVFRNLPDSRHEVLLEQALCWLALSETISNKLGVGGESVWALYVMLDTAVAENLALDHLKSLTGKLFNRFDSFEAAAEDISLEAQRIGNRPEMAECLQLQCRLAMKRGDAARAREYAQEALDLFTELKRADMIRPLKKMIAKLGDKNEEKVKNAA